MSYDPEMKLYGPYKLKDLCVTSTGLPNLPSNKTELDNLIWLAKVLDQLSQSIGPFNVISAFRSYDVNVAVGGNPNKKSYHELGMAADIHPLTMSIDQFFGMILSSDWKDKLGEIILKSDQNTLHIGLPTNSLRGKIMKREKVNGSWTYVNMPLEEQEKYTRNIMKLIDTYGFESNDDNRSLPDPSGGLFTSLYYGMFPLYELVYAKDFEAAIKEKPGIAAAGLLGAGALIALLTMVI